MDPATVNVDNVAPTADFNAPASIDEGSNIVLSLTNPVDVPVLTLAACNMRLIVAAVTVRSAPVILAFLPDR